VLHERPGDVAVEERVSHPGSMAAGDRRTPSG
jgi:hypothetical protein